MGWEVRGGGELSYSLREGWLFDLSASYHSPRFLFGRRRTSDPLIQLGVQKQFLEGQLAVSLRAKAPFGLGERVQEYYRQRLHQQTKELHYFQMAQCVMNMKPSPRKSTQQHSIVLYVNYLIL